MSSMNNTECMVWLGWIKEDEWYGIEDDGYE